MKTKSNRIGKNISPLENNLFYTEVNYKLIYAAYCIVFQIRSNLVPKVYLTSQRLKYFSGVSTLHQKLLAEINWQNKTKQE